jgi:hypothetical protein
MRAIFAYLRGPHGAGNLIGRNGDLNRAGHFGIKGRPVLMRMIVVMLVLCARFGLRRCCDLGIRGCLDGFCAQGSARMCLP